MDHPEDEAGDMPARADVIIYGLGRFGSAIAAGLRERDTGYFLGIDFDPEVIRQWHKRGWPGHYGDAEDPEFLHALPLSTARYVVCTAPGLDSNLTLLQALRDEGYHGKVVLTAHNEADAVRMEQAGADLVLRPFVDAAVRAVEELV